MGRIENLHSSGGEEARRTLKAVADLLRAIADVAASGNSAAVEHLEFALKSLRTGPPREVIGEYNPPHKNEVLYSHTPHEPKIITGSAEDRDAPYESKIIIIESKEDEEQS